MILHVVKSKFSAKVCPRLHISSQKMKKLPTVGGGTPPPPPRSLRSLANIAPPNVMAHYATSPS